ncbi:MULTISPECIES: FHA domain-containing protein [unclassified Duganella]|uniref:FHA domain-containing protein n=1 Tax=unclassified Duganella TaxID=2636909 RepID=UPI0008805922|nr:MULTISPECIES: FHA domain-containing protein [unclassified Duganella]SDG21499.1 FHA domain-containing protein [Duganella sp. OV458]SDJ26805.1 FHA domain-containing protein [Duganella sp. OV510]
MAKLIISRNGQVEQQIQLSKERMTLGRHPRNDIVLADPAVSGEHAAIVTILDDSFLEDLHSTNGTFVNGHRIGKHFLQHQDVIKMARYEVSFLADGIRPLAAAQPVLAELAILNGSDAGKHVALTRPQTALGGVVIQRHPQFYTITHTEGAATSLLNGTPLDAQVAERLSDGDVIDLDGTHMTFRVA